MLYYFVRLQDYETSVESVYEEEPACNQATIQHTSLSSILPLTGTATAFPKRNAHFNSQRDEVQTVHRSGDTHTGSYITLYCIFVQNYARWRRVDFFFTYHSCSFCKQNLHKSCTSWIMRHSHHFFP
jgi:hypothetical protein